MNIVLILETHFTERSVVRIKGYDIIRADHPHNRAHGGAAILRNSSFRYEILSAVRQNYLQAAIIQVFDG